MITAYLETRSLERTLAKIGAVGKDLRPFFREARKVVLKDQREHQQKKEGPTGSWPARAASTVARYKQMRRRGRRPPSRLLGRLPTARRTRTDRKRMVVLWTVKWSIAHQEGKGVPKRPYAWISRALRRELGVVAKRYLQLAVDKSIAEGSR